MKKLSIKKLFLAIFGGFFMLLNVFATPNIALAEGESTPETQQTQQTQQTQESKTKNSDEKGENFCDTELGKLSWRLCPGTEKAASGADWMYEKIEEILVINPVSAKDGEPVYEIWKYCRDIANVVFIIFLLVVTFSQITGVGINNYGIKKALPKLIIAAVLVNLSFIICSLAVDVSNIVGVNIRGLFTSIETSLAGGQSIQELSATYSQYYSAIAGTGGFTIAGLAVAIESGTIWMLIPTVLASLISVAIGLITVAMRQALVILLVMIAPLALVAYILPNTEDLFKKWKKLFIKMLVFFPIMGLLFGASNLAGWAIIRGASNGFMVLLGKAVQYFPLFLAFKMMKMSDTVLGTISGKLTNMTRPLIASNAAWASSHRALTKANMLKNPYPYTPYAKLSQFLSSRRITREEDTAEALGIVKKKGLVYRARRNYDGRGLSRIGKENYDEQAYGMDLDAEILSDKNNFNEGFSDRFDENDPRRAEHLELDRKNVRAADRLYAENVRTAVIDYRNAKGRYERFEAAINAHDDLMHRGEGAYEVHPMSDEARREAINRYQMFNDTFASRNTEQNFADARYIAAEAASAFNAQSQVRGGKFDKWFDMTVPTQDVVNRLKALTSAQNASENIEAIIAGCRILNKRGDGKLLREAVEDLTGKQYTDEEFRDLRLHGVTKVNEGKIKVGTAAAQALASFLMFEVKDNDPFLRRFGKYINLETARYYNEDNILDQHARRKRRDINLKEYALGEYKYVDENGEVQTDKAKRGAIQLLAGTSLKGVEREAYLNFLDGVNAAFVNNDDFIGVPEAEKQKKIKQLNKALLDSIMPNLISDYQGYTSGSEQGLAVPKFLSAMKVTGYKRDEHGVEDMSKPIYNWDHATLGKLSDDEDEAKMIAFNRTRAFLNGMTAQQGGVIKSDSLGAFSKLYEWKAEKDLAETDNEDVARFRREEQQLTGGDDTLINPAANSNDPRTEKERYSHWMFRNSFKKSARGQMAKTLTRGYQSSTKENEIEMMGYNDYKNGMLYTDEVNRFAPTASNNTNRRNNRNNNDEGMPQAPIDEEEVEPGRDLSLFDAFMNSIATRYHDDPDTNITRNNINSAFVEILNNIDRADYRLVESERQAIREIGGILNTFTSTAELFEAVDNCIIVSD